MCQEYEREVITGQVRNDLSLHKRVELHCHTKMSDMDGVSYAKDIIKQAISWGHKAIAITDTELCRHSRKLITLCRIWSLSIIKRVRS